MLQAHINYIIITNKTKQYNNSSGRSSETGAQYLELPDTYTVKQYN